MADKAEKDLYHAPAVQQPSFSDIQEISDSFKFKCSTEEIAACHENLKEILSTSYQRVAEMVGPSLPVKYPRTPGYRPTGKENKYNAWYYKCEIPGAPEGKLAGKRVGIKDSVAVAGVPMMSGSRLMEGYVPEFDATVVTRILDAGGTITGKTSTTDMCVEGTSFTNVTGPILNPYDTSRSSGGSSSGSAVLVATGEVDMAIGGDQGGSIRVPSAWCGIVGLKPTWGLVPYTGAMAIEPILDHVGPMARTVEDCALLLEAIAGYDDGLDPRQLPHMVIPEYSTQLKADLAGKRVGLLQEGFSPCDEDVRGCVRTAAHRLADVGAVVEDVSIPMHSDGLHIFGPLRVEGMYKFAILGNGSGYSSRGYHTLSMQEALCRGMHARPHDTPFRLKSRCIQAEYLRRTYQNKFYSKAQNLNILLTKEYNKALQDYDVLVMPTVTSIACKLPKASAPIDDLMSIAGSLANNCAPFNVTGHPALTVNAGFCQGMPVGMMIVGRHFDELNVLQTAYSYEKLGPC